MKKLTLDDLKGFRDRLYLDIPDSALEDNPYLPPYYHPGEHNDEIQYLQERRHPPGGEPPSPRSPLPPVELPPPSPDAHRNRGPRHPQSAPTMAPVRPLID